MRSSTIALFLLCWSIASSGQSLALSVVGETSVRGLQYGATALYETKHLFGIGGFYQQDATPSVETGKVSTFYGGHLQFALAKENKIAVLAMMRAGLVDKHLLVVVPALETRIMLTKRLATGVDVGMRMGYPSLSARLILSCF